MTADEIRERREALGLSRVELAARLGCPLSTVWRWEERGNRPSRFALQALREVLSAQPAPAAEDRLEAAS